MSTYRVEITATDAIGRSGIVGGEHTTVITTADISADEAYTTIVGIGGQGGIADAHFCGAATAIRSSDLSLAERLRDHYGLSTPLPTPRAALGGTQAALLAICGLWLLTRRPIITNAGIDFQSDVMFNPASNGTGIYGPACYIAISSDFESPLPTDLALPGEVTTGPLSRAPASYGHTVGTATTTLSKLFTSDQTILVAKAAVFNQAAGGSPITESLFAAAAQLTSGSQINVVVNMNQ